MYPPSRGPTPSREGHDGRWSTRPHSTPGPLRSVRQPTRGWSVPTPIYSTNDSNQGYEPSDPSHMWSSTNLFDATSPPSAPFSGASPGHAALLERLVPGTASWAPLTAPQPRARLSRPLEGLAPYGAPSMVEPHHPPPSGHRNLPVSPRPQLNPSPPIRPATISAPPRFETAAGVAHPPNVVLDAGLASAQGNRLRGNWPTTGDTVGSGPLSPVTPPTSPIAANSDLDIFLTREQLRQELQVPTRHGLPWKYWEHNIIVFEVVGPGAPLDFFTTAMCTPRKPTAEQLARLDRMWHGLADVPFNGVRKPGTLVTQWWALVDTHDAIIRFAESTGVNVHLPRFDDPTVLVKQLVANWKLCALGGSWGTLTQEQMAVWTYNLGCGWLGMMHRCLRAWGPTRLGKMPNQLNSLAVRNPRHATIDPSYPFPGAIANPTVPDEQPTGAQSTGPTQLSQPRPPTSVGDVVDENAEMAPQDNIYMWNVPPSPKMNNDTLAVPRSTVDEGKDEGKDGSAVALRKILSTMGDVITMDQGERELRMRAAVKILNSTGASRQLREKIEAWCIATFFSRNSSDDLARSMIYWQRRLGVTHVATNPGPAGALGTHSSTGPTLHGLSPPSL